MSQIEILRSMYCFNAAVADHRKETKLEIFYNK